MGVKKSQKNKPEMISDEEIEKAFDQLQLVADNFSKANDEDEDEDFEEEEDGEETEEEEDEEEEEVEKANEEMEEDDEDEDEDDEEEEEEEKPQPKKKVKKATVKKTIKKSNEGKAMGSHSESVKEGVEVSEFLKGLVEDVDGALQRQNRVLGNMAIVMKGIVEKINDLDGAVSTPRERKSKLSKNDVAERFSKGNEDGMENGKKVIGLRSGHKEIVKALDALTFSERGVNMEMASALTLYEASHELRPTIQKAVEDQLGAKIDASL